MDYFQKKAKAKTHVLLFDCNKSAPPFLSSGRGIAFKTQRISKDYLSLFLQRALNIILNKLSDEFDLGGGGGKQILVCVTLKWIRHLQISIILLATWGVHTWTWKKDACPFSIIWKNKMMKDYLSRASCPTRILLPIHFPTSAELQYTVPSAALQILALVPRRQWALVVWFTRVVILWWCRKRGAVMSSERVNSKIGRARRERFWLVRIEMGGQDIFVYVLLEKYICLLRRCAG